MNSSDGPGLGVNPVAADQVSSAERTWLMSHPLRTVVQVKVRDAIRLLESDGWVLDRQRGSHRQFRHPTKPGTVTVSGKLGSDLRVGTMASVFNQAGLRRKQ
jgi:predicted RNA binding protein YcfA (HicA-like mRNA interferase family)